jgi:hypothetical protein
MGPTSCGSSKMRGPPPESSRLGCSTKTLNPSGLRKRGVGYLATTSRRSPRRSRNLSLRAVQPTLEFSCQTKLETRPFQSGKIPWRGTPGCGSVHGLRLFSHPAHYLFSMESPIAADSEARNLALLVVQLNPFFVTLACKRWRWFGGRGVAPAARREGFCLRYSFGAKGI